eukprot:CAMPEP_0117739474 /NCGR_PEP_ID=MMETSP0947-20121206/3769_1 /TAXON_ID=44440 /ORGANISM="Chattonella subsalsa, Strain CCMP2191" /LENGTH=92 /DNA_ID=CAMNT_0005555407 /DNA_START=489 /DNA_END=764 /DNA_ORIENTATION=-
MQPLLCSSSSCFQHHHPNNDALEIRITSTKHKDDFDVSYFICVTHVVEPIAFGATSLSFYIIVIVWEKKVFGSYYHSIMHVMMAIPQGLMIS